MAVWWLIGLLPLRGVLVDQVLQRLGKGRQFVSTEVTTAKQLLEDLLDVCEDPVLKYAHGRGLIEAPAIGVQALHRPAMALRKVPVERVAARRSTVWLQELSH